MRTKGPPPDAPSPVVEDGRPPMGLTRCKVLEGFAGTLTLERSSGADGQPRYMGQFAGTYVLVEAIGKEEGVRHVTAVVMPVNDDPAANARLMVAYVRLMKNCVPGWTRALEFFNENTPDSPDAQGVKASEVYGKKRIDLTSTPGTGFTVTVEGMG